MRENVQRRDGLELVGDTLRRLPWSEPRATGLGSEATSGREGPGPAGILPPGTSRTRGAFLSVFGGSFIFQGGLLIFKLKT